MSVIIHSLCDECWEKRYKRSPMRIANPVKEKCCDCGKPTSEGIYVHLNQNELSCKGNHA